MQTQQFSNKMELSVIKNCNSWQLLLIVATDSFVLNVIGLLDSTLNIINKLRLRKESILFSIYLLKVSKKNTRTLCQIYSKLTIKKPEQYLVLLLLTLNLFCTLLYCYYCWIRTNKYLRAWEIRVFDNEFTSGPMEWGNLLGEMFSSLFTQHKVVKG